MSAPQSTEYRAEPCTTAGCDVVKFFPGPCNVCSKKNAVVLANPYAGMGLVEECMAKQRERS